MYRVYFACESGGRMAELTPRLGSVVKTMIYVPAAGDGRVAREEIRLGLAGAADEIEGLLSQISRAIEQAGRESGLPGGDTVYLVCQVARESGAAWRSRVLSGRLGLGSAGADQRAARVQGCVLELARDDFWEYAERLLLLEEQNPFGDTGGGDGLVIANHADAQHANTVDVPARVGAAETVTGDLPAPLELVLRLLDDSAAQPLTYAAGEIVAAAGAGAAVAAGAASAGAGALGTLSAAYGAELGGPRGAAAAALLDDDTCAGGQCLRLSWNGAGEQEIFAIDLPAGEARVLAGRPLRIAMRLAEPLSRAAEEKTWYCWKVYALNGGSERLAGESAGQYLEQGSQLALGPALNLPPWPVDLAYNFAVPALRLALSVQAAGSGAHALTIDALSLLGLDGWRIYRPLSAGTAGPQGLGGIDDNGLRGTLYACFANEQTHAAEGPGLWVAPGRDHRFSFIALRHDPAQDSLPIDLEMKVWLYYRPRKRVL